MTKIELSLRHNLAAYLGGIFLRSFLLIFLRLLVCCIVLVFMLRVSYHFRVLAFRFFFSIAPEDRALSCFRFHANRFYIMFWLSEPPAHRIVVEARSLCEAFEMCGLLR